LKAFSFFELIRFIVFITFLSAALSGFLLPFCQALCNIVDKTLFIIVIIILGLCFSQVCGSDAAVRPDVQTAFSGPGHDRGSARELPGLLNVSFVVSLYYTTIAG